MITVHWSVLAWIGVCGAILGAILAFLAVAVFFLAPEPDDPSDKAGGRHG